MTTIEIVRTQKGHIDAFRISGHSGYEESGKDIICSSISTAVNMTVGMTEKLGLKYDYRVEEETATLQFDLQSTHDIAILVLDNFYEHVIALSKEYKQYLKITEKRR